MAMNRGTGQRLPAVIEAMAGRWKWLQSIGLAAVFLGVATCSTRGVIADNLKFASPFIIGGAILFFMGRIVARWKPAGDA